MAKASELAKAGCKYLGVLYSIMDCQAFIEKALADIGIHKNLTGSNAWYRAMTWVGTPEECKRIFGSIPNGAFLFIHENDGKEPAKYRNDGKGNASHIGIKTGMTGEQMVELAIADGDKKASGCNFGNGAIHSSYTREKVSTSTFNDKTIRGGWNKVGLWNQIDYGEAINRKLGTVQSDDGPAGVETLPDKPIGTGTVFASSGTTVKLRQRPSTGCGIYWDVPIGDTVQIYKTGDWDRVKWNGKIGYIKGEFVKVGQTMADIEPDPDTPLLAMVWAPEGNTVKMRYKPSTDCGIYEKVPIGAEVAVNQKGDKWCKISIGNRSGWYMMTKFLKFKED